MLTIFLDRASPRSLYEQIYHRVRAEIEDGMLPAGFRMPSKRELALHLETSLVTVATAYAQLVAEGYLRAAPRSGHFVLPSGSLPKREAPAPAPSQPEEPYRRPRIDFSTGAVDQSLFPYATWARIARGVLAGPETDLLNTGHPQGSYALRAAIAAHLASYRGVAADPRAIVIGAGSEYLTGLLVQLLGRACRYAVEDPGYPKIARIVQSNGARVVNIPLDAAGLDVERLRDSGAEVVHVTPSHQFPTGIVMPVGRRRELLAWADGQPERMIIEDDYDSEFRFAGQPIPALRSLDRGDRVVYMNSFTKSLAPALRVSYMVLPAALLVRFRAELGHYACTVSNIEQATLARFMADGHFERHLARVRNQYRDRRDRLLRALAASSLGSSVAPFSEDAGLHFPMRVRNGMSEAGLVATAAAAGIRLTGLSSYRAVPDPDAKPTVVLGYGGIPADGIETAVAELAALWAR